MYLNTKNLLFLALVSLMMLVMSCGQASKNFYESYEKDDAAGDAANELEDDDPEKAIEILEKALEDDPKDYQLISLLSAAYSQKHGVDLVGIVTRMAEDPEESNEEESGAGSNNALMALWPFLPDATSDNLDGVGHAVSLLRSIPESKRTDADYFKLAILSTVLVSLELKALDINGDGELSAQELFNLGPEAAIAILSGLLGAVESMNGMSESLGGNSDGAGDRIGEIYTAIDEAEGEDEAEKVANYIQSSQQQ